MADIDLSSPVETLNPVTEDAVVTVSHALDVFDTANITEDFAYTDGLFFIDQFDSFTLAEDFVVDMPIVLEPFVDNISVTEQSPGPTLAVGHALIAFDVLGVSEFRYLGLNPQLISVFRQIAVNEFVYFGFDIISIFALQALFVSEIAYRQTVADTSFSQFDRSYPFEEETQFNVLVQTFESGAEQRRDKWGRSKKSFTIQFAPRVKDDIDDIKQFYEQNSGSANLFNFTNPLDGIVYTVRFEANSLKIQRIAFNVYQASVQLVEVF